MSAKKILVTGAGGFIGSHLAERLTKLGYDVRAFVRYNSESDWGWLEHSPFIKDMEIFSGDIRDFDSVRRAMKGCREVFHLAALIGIPYSYDSPLAYIKTNIEGTYNVLENARDLNIGNIMVTSTSETYGTAQFVPITENHPLVGQSPYSASKVAADQLALSYWLSFGLPVKIARPFNTFGPRQSSRAIIPTIAGQILAGRRSLNLGNLSPTRDLTYVTDTVDGMIKISRCKKLSGSVTNIGSGFEISVKDLALEIADICGVKIGFHLSKDRKRPPKSEVERLYCDNSKLAQNTKWQPRFTLRQGLKQTIDWIKDNLHHYKTELYIK
ncbi:MAG TPA: SDR family NAD(P)-dependent oxidoreductase [Smithella sp.]|nr:SDR family NAD(P)-dependent oxidoreductase [Smithella sp.]